MCIFSKKDRTFCIHTHTHKEGKSRLDENWERKKKREAGDSEKALGVPCAAPESSPRPTTWAESTPLARQLSTGAHTRFLYCVVVVVVELYIHTDFHSKETVIQFLSDVLRVCEISWRHFLQRFLVIIVCIGLFPLHTHTHMPSCVIPYSQCCVIIPWANSLCHSVATRCVRHWGSLM